MSENTDPVALHPLCYFCKKETDADHLCYGCEEYVCEDCTDIDNDPWDDHGVSDHPAGDKRCL